MALFPYLPDTGGDDFRSLVSYIRAEFERERPGIRLEIRSLVDEPGNHYDLDVLSDWLTGSDGYDLVEIDTILLRDLVEAGLVSPWPLPPGIDDWLPVSRESATVDGMIYGVPHFLCGYFVISEHQGVAQAPTGDELEARLRGLGTSRIDLVGKMLGSATQPTLYVDAWADAHPTAAPAEALRGPLDVDVLGEMLDLARLCHDADSSVNRCMTADRYFDASDTTAAEFYAAGHADALIGYSERLSVILAEADTLGRTLPPLHIGSAPMGGMDRPVLFADAFVLRAQPERAVQEAAAAFVAFMNRPDTQDAVLMSLDVEPRADGSTAIPRYLLPATRTAFDAPHISADRYYPMLLSEIDGARALPNGGFWRDRYVIRNVIDAWIQERLRGNSTGTR